MKAWSLGKALRRTGVPALVLLVGKTAVDASRRPADAPLGQVVLNNILGMTLLWVAIALLMWAVTNIARGRRA